MGSVWNVNQIALIGTSLLLCLTACNADNPRQQYLAAIGQPDAPYIQPVFQTHVDTFKQEAAARGVTVDTSNLTVVLKSLTGTSDLLGECNADYTLVEIDPNAWNSRSLYGQEQILFHELGHCLLNRLNHTDSTLAYAGKTIPVSLMAATGTTLYNENSRGYYLDELFNAAQAAELTADSVVAQGFSIEKESYMTTSSVGTVNQPTLAYLNADSVMQYLDPAQCTLLSVTNLQNVILAQSDEIVTVTPDNSLQFNTAGNYVVNFNCNNETYTEAFTINTNS